ncbi:MAG: hypothetical protein HQM04_18645, partial [Magnetococcales bacterium]|nr:hypothetical protein [Magnetococcales bacterium]
ASEIHTSNAGGSGDQTYTGAVTLNDGNTASTFTFVSNTGDITFANRIDGQNTGQSALIVNTAGITVFKDKITLASLTTDAPGETHIATDEIITTGDQTFNGSFTLILDTTLKGGTFTFDALDAKNVGQERLTIEGNAIFRGKVGNTVPLGALSVRGTTLFTRDASLVKTDSSGGESGNQTYTGAVTLNAGDTPATFTFVSNTGDITFASQINGQNAGQSALSVNSAQGSVKFMGAIGTTTPLQSLSIQAPKIILSGNDVQYKTTGLQHYDGDETVMETDVTLNTTDSMNGTVTFDSPIQANSSAGHAFHVTTNSSDVVFNHPIHGLNRLTIQSQSGHTSLHDIRLFSHDTTQSALLINPDEASPGQVRIGSTIRLSSTSRPGGLINLGRADVVPRNPNSTLVLNTSGKNQGGNITLGQITYNEAGEYFDTLTINMGALSNNPGKLTIHKGLIAVDKIAQTTNINETTASEDTIHITGKIRANGSTLRMDTNPRGREQNSGTINLESTILDAERAAAILLTTSGSTGNVAPNGNHDPTSTIAGDVRLGTVGTTRKPIGALTVDTRATSQDTKATTHSGTLRLYNHIQSKQDDLNFSNAQNVVLNSDILLDTHTPGNNLAGNVIFRESDQGHINGRHTLTIDTRKTVTYPNDNNEYVETSFIGGIVHLPTIGDHNKPTNLIVDGGNIFLHGNIFIDPVSNPTKTTSQVGVIFHQNTLFKPGTFGKDGPTPDEYRQHGITVQARDAAYSCTINNLCRSDLESVEREAISSSFRILRIATGGGNLLFRNLEAWEKEDTSADDHLNFRHVELLASHAFTDDITNRSIKSRVKDLYTATPSYEGGFIRGNLDVWNATLSGAGGRLTGNIHRTKEIFAEQEMTQFAAAQTIFTAPHLPGTFKFTFNRFPVPGEGAPTHLPYGFDNLTRGSMDKIPDRTSQRNWNLDSSQNPNLHAKLAQWKDDEEDKNKRRDTIAGWNQDNENYRGFVQTIQQLIETHKTNKIAIVIGVGYNEEFELKNLSKVATNSAIDISQMLEKVGYKTLNFISTDQSTSPAAQKPKWENILMAIKAFSEVARQHKPKDMNNPKALELIIYFAGHGVLHEDKGYWILQGDKNNTKIGKDKDIISYEQIKTALTNTTTGNPTSTEAAPPSKVLLMIESCFPADMSPVSSMAPDERDPDYSEQRNEAGAIMSMTATKPYLPLSYYQDGSYFSKFLNATINHQLSEAGVFDISRIHSLIRQEYAGWNEWQSYGGKSTLLYQMLDIEPQYGVTSHTSSSTFFLHKDEKQP